MKVRNLVAMIFFLQWFGFQEAVAPLPVIAVLGAKLIRNLRKIDVWQYYNCVTFDRHFLFIAKGIISKGAPLITKSVLNEDFRFMWNFIVHYNLLIFLDSAARAGGKSALSGGLKSLGSGGMKSLVKSGMQSFSKVGGRLGGNFAKKLGGKLGGRSSSTSFMRNAGSKFGRKSSTRSSTSQRPQLRRQIRPSHGKVTEMCFVYRAYTK